MAKTKNTPLHSVIPFLHFVIPAKAGIQPEGGAMAKTKIRRGDDVLVIAGKDKGKTGRVLNMVPEKNRVIVEGVNMVTKHYKPRPGIRQGGRVQQEASIHISNIKLIQSNYTEPSTQFRNRDE